MDSSCTALALVRPAAGKRKAAESSNALGVTDWVTVRLNQTRQVNKNIATAPAIVSSIDQEKGTVNVLFPNRLSAFFNRFCPQTCVRFSIRTFPLSKVHRHESPSEELTPLLQHALASFAELREAALRGSDRLRAQEESVDASDPVATEVDASSASSQVRSHESPAGELTALGKYALARLAELREATLSGSDRLFTQEESVPAPDPVAAQADASPASSQVLLLGNPGIGDHGFVDEPEEHFPWDDPDGEVVDVVEAASQPEALRTYTPLVKAMLANAQAADRARAAAQRGDVAHQAATEPPPAKRRIANAEAVPETPPAVSHRAMAESPPAASTAQGPVESSCPEFSAAEKLVAPQCSDMEKGATQLPQEPSKLPGGRQINKDKGDLGGFTRELAQLLREAASGCMPKAHVRESLSSNYPEWDGFLKQLDQMNKVLLAEDAVFSLA